jgi:hypothetical protein
MEGRERARGLLWGDAPPTRVVKEPIHSQQTRQKRLEGEGRKERMRWVSVFMYTLPCFYPATRQGLGFTGDFFTSETAERRQNPAGDPAGKAEARDVLAEAHWLAAARQLFVVAAAGGTPNATRILNLAPISCPGGGRPTIAAQRRPSPDEGTAGVDGDAKPAESAIPSGLACLRTFIPKAEALGYCRNIPLG